MGFKKDKERTVYFRQEVVNCAWENIKIRSIGKIGKPDSFSSYIECLILEDWEKNKALLMQTAVDINK